MTAEAHSILGPSSAVRWLSCSQSTHLIRQHQPEEASTAAALEGRAAHTVLEAWALEALAYRGYALDEKRVREVAHARMLLDQDEQYDVPAMQEGAWIAVNHLIDLIKLDPDATVWVEEKVNLYRYPHVFGTADLVVWLPHRRDLHVIDYKYGRVEVEAEHNPQLTLYMMMVMDSLIKPNFEVASKMPNVTLTIIQPRSTECVVKHWALDIEWLKTDFLPTLWAAIDAADDADKAVYHISEAGCRYCPVMRYCPEVKAMAEEACGFSDIGSEVDFAEWLPRLSVLRAWADEVEGAALQHLIDGNEITGYGLAPRQGNRRWSSESMVIEFLKKKGFALKDIAPPKILSPAQMDKLIEKSTKKIAKKDLAGYSSRPDLGQKLVKRKL
jgi:hypothetical protein